MTMSASMPTIVRNTDQQIWRDLDWLINSPSLVEGLAHYHVATFTPTQQERHQEWLYSKLIEQDIKTIGLRSRLGLYAEDLLTLALTHTPSVHLLHQHFPIQEKLSKRKRTIGELDYIWQDEQTQLIQHWELAVKLFLYIPPESDIALTPISIRDEDIQLLQKTIPMESEKAHALLLHLNRFIGTQKKDTLLRKLLHLQKKQLPLAQQVSQILGLNIHQSNYFIKGWLFYPLKEEALSWSDYQMPIGLPWISNNHLRGWWLKEQELIKRLKTAPSHWRWKILHRLQWLSPHQCTLEETVHIEQVYETIQRQWQFFEQYNEPPQPLLLCAMHTNDKGHYQEIHRGFVVPKAFID